MNKILSLLLMSGLIYLPSEQVVAEDDVIELSLPRLGGEDLKFSDYRGQWLVVNYWATWCAPCRKEIPELSELHDERADIAVLGLAFEDANESDFEIFLSEFEVTYPILLVDVYDPPEPFGSPKALPTTYILNPEGRSVKTFVGPITRQALESFIDENGSAKTD
jgi:thiol-disulfide isomerase/thioredoxin